MLRIKFSDAAFSSKQHAHRYFTPPIFNVSCMAVTASLMYPFRLHFSFIANPNSFVSSHFSSLESTATYPITLLLFFNTIARRRGFPAHLPILSCVCLSFVNAGYIPTSRIASSSQKSGWICSASSGKKHLNINLSVSIFFVILSFLSI